MLGGIEIVKEIGKLQMDYDDLRLDGKLTKKAMCDLVIPFRDKYGLSDKDALAIARNEMHIDEMAKVIEDGFKKKFGELKIST